MKCVLHSLISWRANGVCQTWLQFCQRCASTELNSLLHDKEKYRGCVRWNYLLHKRKHPIKKMDSKIAWHYSNQMLMIWYILPRNFLNCSVKVLFVFTSIVLLVNHVNTLSVTIRNIKGSFITDASYLLSNQLIISLKSGLEFFSTIQSLNWVHRRSWNKVTVEEVQLVFKWNHFHFFFAGKGEASWFLFILGF